MTSTNTVQTIQSLLTVAAAGLTVAGAVNPSLNVSEITKIISLAVALEPSVATLINQVVGAFDGDKTSEEREKELDEIIASLQPMVEKV